MTDAEITSYNPEPKSRGGDNPVSRRCYDGQHERCPGRWTQYPDESGPCECDCHKANRAA